MTFWQLVNFAKASTIRVLFFWHFGNRNCITDSRRYLLISKYFLYIHLKVNVYQVLWSFCFDETSAFKMTRVCNRNLSSEWISNFAFQTQLEDSSSIETSFCAILSRFPNFSLNNGFGKSSLEFANLKANKAIQFRSLLFEFISSCLRFRLFPESLSFEHISSSSAHHKPRKTTANLIKRKLCHQKII